VKHDPLSSILMKSIPNEGTVAALITYPPSLSNPPSHREKKRKEKKKMERLTASPAPASNPSIPAPLSPVPCFLISRQRAGRGQGGEEKKGGREATRSATAFRCPRFLPLPSIISWFKGEEKKGRKGRDVLALRGGLRTVCPPRPPEKREERERESEIVEGSLTSLLSTSPLHCSGGRKGKRRGGKEGRLAA